MLKVDAHTLGGQGCVVVLCLGDFIESNNVLIVCNN